MKKNKVFLIALLITMLIVVSLALVGCKDDETVQLSAVKTESITYDGETLKFEPVENAISYTINVNDGTGIFISLADGATSLSYKMMLEEDFKVSIVSNATSDGFTDSLPIEKNFTYKGKVANLKLEEKFVVWDNIENAKYRVERNGVLTSESLNTNKLELLEGENNIRVLAVFSDINSFACISDLITAEKLLTPKNIKYDGEKLTFDVVSNAQEYEMVFKIDGVEQPVKTTNECKYLFNATQKSFEVKVRAISDIENIVESNYSVKTFSYTTPVTGLKIEDGIVYFDAKDGAEVYELVIKNSIDNTETVVYTKENFYAELEASYAGDKVVSFDIKVKPHVKNSSSYTQFSKTLSCAVLNSPEARWNNYNLVWQDIADAEGYQVVVKSLETGNIVINNKVQSGTSINIRELEDKEGNYLAYIVAVGNNETYTSKRSNFINIHSLYAPNAIEIKSDSYSAENPVKVEFNPVKYATGYDIYVAGVNVTETVKMTSATSFEFIPINGFFQEQICSISIVPKHDKNNMFIEEENAVYLNCTQSRGLKINAIKLATVTGVEIVGNTIRWNAVSKANGYILSVVNERGESVAEIKADIITNTAFNLPEGLKEGIYGVSLSARGNEGIMLVGDASSQLQFVKFPAPKNIKASADNKTISWDTCEYQGATTTYSPAQYKVFIGSTNMGIVENNYVSIDNVDIGIRGEQIVVTALGKGNKEGEIISIDSNPSNRNVGEIFIAYKLRTVDRVMISDTILSWNNVENNNGYIIRTHNNDLTLGDDINPTKDNEIAKDQTSCDLRDLLKGYQTEDKEIEFNISIIAKGGTSVKNTINSKYFDSNRSVGNEVELLRTPKITVPDKQNGKIVFSNNLIATGYVFEVLRNNVLVYDEVVMQNNNEQIYFQPIIEGNDGDNMLIKVSAMGDNGISIISSYPYEYRFNLKKLTALNKEDFKYEMRNEENNREISIVFSENAMNTIGFGIGINFGGIEKVVDKKTLIENNNVYVYNATSSVTIPIKIRAYGGNYGEIESKPVCYIASDYSSTKTIHLLKALSANQVSFTTAGVGDITKRSLEFKSQANCVEYSYKITYQNSDGETVADGVISGTINANLTEKNSILLQNITADVYFIKVEIKSLGDNITSFDSQNIFTSVYTA